MESLTDILSVVCQYLDVDLCVDMSAELYQTLIVSLSCLLALVHSHPLGYGLLAQPENVCAVALDCILLPFKRISTKSFLLPPCFFYIFSMAKRSIPPSKLSCHINC